MRGVSRWMSTHISWASPLRLTQSAELAELRLSGLISSAGSTSRGSDSKRICPAIEQILPSTFVYLQITTFPCTPGQALHPVCGQQRPRELAQQGNSPVGCGHPSSFPQGGTGCCCVAEDAHCKGLALQGMLQGCSWLAASLS